MDEINSKKEKYALEVLLFEYISLENNVTENTGTFILHVVTIVE